MEMIFMVTAIYLAINKSAQKLTVQKIGSNGSENKELLKKSLKFVVRFIGKLFWMNSIWF